MLVSGTLANRANAGFEPTPARYAQIIADHILAFAPHQLRPGEAYTVLEPCIGVGDLAAPIAALPGVQLYAVEQDPQRADHSRTRFPAATILTTDLAAIKLSPSSFSLALCNFPYGYDQLLGGRLEYQMLKQVTDALLPGGVLVDIVPARSGWDNLTIAYIGKHYERIHAWRFFDEAPTAEERFSTFTQIVVVALKRRTPLLRVPDDIKQQLKGWQWRAEQGWAGTPPEPLPLTSIAERYHVPATTVVPTLRQSELSTADLLGAVHRSGMHHSPAWQDATNWHDGAHVPNPLMAYAGAAHIVGGFVTGFLDGQILTAADGTPFVFSSFQSKERVRIELDADDLAEEHGKGVESISVFEIVNKPMVGALNLTTGETTFAQGEEVYELLQPWMATIAHQVMAHRPPLYEPSLAAPWQYRLATTIGADKQLPGAAHPGLAAPQFHISAALYAGLEQRGRAAVQGAPGTGKTRQTILTAAMLAYRWRHRPANIQRVLGADGTISYELIDVQKTLPADEVATFVGRKQSRWMRGLWRAWKANPHLPGDAPRALPIIVTSPKRVVRSAWEQEIRGAFPRAEVVHIETRADLLRFFQRCAHTAAPAVFGIIPQSLTRCFTTVVAPDVIPQTQTVTVNDLSEAAAAHGEAQTDEAGNVIAYRNPETELPITKTETATIFRCPSCGQVITAPLPFAQDADEVAPVEALEWFEQQKRWCPNAVLVSHNRDGETGEALGRPILRICGAPLWTTRRVGGGSEAGDLDFGAWTVAIEELEARRRSTWLPRPAPAYSRIVNTPDGFATAAVSTDAESPFRALYRDFAGCVALTIVDESHNAMGQNTDIARSIHYSQLAAQSVIYASGTHYAGTLDRFYHYWFRFDPHFWKQFGFGWSDMAAASQVFGVIQTWIREYPEKANKGTGAQTRVSVNSVLAPGIDAALFPYLLESMGFITIHDVGALMPEKREFPRLVDMHDPVLDVVQARMGAKRATWIEQRNLDAAYDRIVARLEELSKQRIAAATIAKGTIPRWYPPLCCETPAFTVTRTHRTEWGKAIGEEVILTAPVLAADYIYPLERALRTEVHKELKAGRRIMIYIEQAGKRHIDQRLEKALRPIAQAHRTGIWTLTTQVDAREREAEICAAVERGNHILLVPYRLVSEGVNLQRHIDTIMWYEMARNRFALDQASDRAWRLGRPIEADGTQRPVRIYFFAYAGSAGHKKLRKLAQENGAAQLFAGNTPEGALAHAVGANKTPIARMSASLKEQQASLDAAFAQRAADLSATLSRGRTLQAAADPVPTELAAAWQTPARSADLWGRSRGRATPSTSAASVRFGEAAIWTARRSGAKRQDQAPAQETTEQLTLF
jgi:SAM-dependent methyltransferase